MSFNLIEEKWIPVVKRNGKRERIAPWEITVDYANNPIVSLDAPRADFNGALIQFLIGLVQTFAAPKGEEDWDARWENPPDPWELREAFRKCTEVFDLSGDGSRFMQDLHLRDTESRPLAMLLIDSPGENTVQKNTDFFVKRGFVSDMCLPCAAMALFTLQTNAPAGGQGVRTSLRGGGPLTTVIVGQTLWESVWLNVLERDRLAHLCRKELDANEYKFPWLAPTRTSENGQQTTAHDVHACQMFWGMPRRIRLDLDDTVTGKCSLCGAELTKLVSSFRARNYGINYSGPWLHPLTPHSINRENIPLPFHPQPGGLTYRYWLGLVIEDAGTRSQPAEVVRAFLRRRKDFPELRFRLWAFGYDMENMKPRCWYEATMPLILVEESHREAYEKEVISLIIASQKAADSTKRCIKSAWFRRPKDIRGDLPQIAERFWHDTENDFYSTLEAIRRSMADSSNTEEVRNWWFERIRRQALSLFEDQVLSAPIEESDPERIVKARRQLMKELAGLKKVLNLTGKSKELPNRGTPRS